MRPPRIAILACLAQPLLAGAAFGAGPLMQHRAVYDLALGQASERSGITGIDGRMVYELRGSSDDGYTVRFRYVTRSSSGEITQLADQRTTTFESADGKSFRFETQSYLDQALEKELRGSAKLEASGLKVQIDKPAPKKVELPSTHFPTQHLFELIDEAKAGKTFYETSIFDGSEDADKVMTTTVIVGRKAMAETNDPELTTLGKLGGESFWPVDIAYFDSENQAGEVTPDYRISFKLYENGLTRDLEMDYGDFVIEGTLVDLQVLEPQGGAAEPSDDAGSKAAAEKAKAAEAAAKAAAEEAEKKAAAEKAKAAEAVAKTEAEEAARAAAADEVARNAAAEEAARNAAAREAARTEAAAKRGRAHIVVAGDNFWDLAKTYFGDGSKWPVIARANPKFKPNKLAIGSALEIPPPGTPG